MAKLSDRAGAPRLSSLIDVPSRVGHAGKFARVNNTEDGIEWVEAETDRIHVTTINYDSGSSNILIPTAIAGSHMMHVMVKVINAFDGVNPTLSLGVLNDIDGIADTSNIDLTTTLDNPQVFDTWYTMQSTTNVLGTLTVSGATQGSCQVAIRQVN